MKGTNRVYILAAILILVATAITFISFAVLYDSAFEQQRNRLADAASSQASLIAAIARHHEATAPLFLEKIPDYDTYETTIMEVKDAHRQCRGIGRTGEFTIARLEGDQIIFVLNHRHASFDELQPIPFQSLTPGPMHYALRGETGTIIGLDYRGEKVLAAYQPVGQFGLGVVAKIDLSEIRAPFIRAGSITGLIAIVLIIIGVVASVRVSNPIIREIMEKETYLADLVSTAPGCVYQSVISSDGIFSLPFISPAVKEMFGIEADLLMKDAGKMWDFIHPDDHQSVRDSLAESAKSQLPRDHVFRAITSDKGIMWIRARSNPRQLPDGGTIWNGILTDITTQMQAESVMKRNQEMLIQSHYISRMGSFEWHIDSGNLNISSGIYELVKYNFGDICELDYVMNYILHPDDRRSAKRWAIAGFKNGKKHLKPFHCRLICKDGDIINVQIEGRTDYKDGKAVRLIGTCQDVTQFKQIEAELRDSRDYAENLIQTANAMIVGLDKEGQVIIFNKAAEKITGYTKKEMESSDWFETLAPKDCYPEIRKIFDESLANGEIKNFENPILTKSGEEKYIVWQNSENIEQGEFAGSILFGIDITPRRKAENALVKSEKKYRLLVENQTDLVVKVNRQGIFEYVSPTYCKMFGKSEADLLGHTYMPQIHEDDREAATEAMKAIFDKPYTCYVEQRAITKDGWKWLAWAYSAILDDQNNVKTIIGIGRDVTARKETEIKLSELSAKNEALLEAVPDIITEIDNNKILCWTNSAGYEFFGEDMIGREAGYYFEDDQQTYQAIEPLFKGDEDIVYVENWQRRIDGEKRLLAWWFTTLRDFDGDITGAISTGRDITDLRRLQEKEARNERLDTAGRVARQVAHDFNNLLAPLLAYPEFIREDLPVGCMSRKYLNDMERSAKKIANINQQLLTLGGRGFYDHEAMDLNETAQLALAELGTLPSGVTCEINLNDNIPYIRGGNLQIQRVIQNLLMNATTAIETEGTIRIKTEQCGIRPMVGAHGEIPGGEYVKLTVSDTGIGISNEMLLKIFDPFFTTKRLDIERGCGLGLSVVDSVIKDHRGYIDIKSQLGEGTDFSIYFPAVKGLANSQSNVFKHNYGGRETVLVIDDDQILRNVTSISLKKLGYRVTSVESGEAAIEFLKDNPQDILILDMVMPPGIDGTETYRQILKLNPEQRAIIVSGFSSSDKITEALALGVGSFVRKPLNDKTLARALRHELDRIVPQRKMQTSAF